MYSHKYTQVLSLFNETHYHLHMYMHVCIPLLAVYDQFLQVLDMVASMNRSHAKVAVCRALYMQAYATVK